MSKIECVCEEQQRLQSLFALDTLDDSKKALVSRLVDEVAFMKVELDLLKEQIHQYGAVQVSKTGRQRQSEPAKYYTKLIASFSATLKTISSIIGKGNDEQEDELDKFIKSV